MPFSRRWDEIGKRLISIKHRVDASVKAARDDIFLNKERIILTTRICKKFCRQKRRKICLIKKSPKLRLTNSKQKDKRHLQKQVQQEHKKQTKRWRWNGYKIDTCKGKQFLINWVWNMRIINTDPWCLIFGKLCIFNIQCRIFDISSREKYAFERKDIMVTNKYFLYKINVVSFYPVTDTDSARYQSPNIECTISKPKYTYN